MNERELQGRMSAPVEKRYKSFITSVVDREEVWMLSKWKEDVHLQGEYRDYYVWPMKEFANFFSEEVVCVEVHDFCDWCAEEMDKGKVRFQVFYNGRNAFVASAQEMLSDIEEELERVE